jgi:hypothetical protein
MNGSTGQAMVSEAFGINKPRQASESANFSHHYFWPLLLRARRRSNHPEGIFRRRTGRDETRWKSAVKWRLDFKVE